MAASAWLTVDCALEMSANTVAEWALNSLRLSNFFWLDFIRFFNFVILLFVELMADLEGSGSSIRRSKSASAIFKIDPSLINESF